MVDCVEKDLPDEYTNNEEILEPETLEFLEQTHRKEKKELQAKIQVLKKSAAKGDKKKKKSINEDIIKLEEEIQQRHQRELADLKTKLGLADEVKESKNPLEKFENLALYTENNQQRCTKAQRRRDKKSTQLKERELRILEQDAINLTGARHSETEEIKKILKNRNLMILDVASDGNCLYNAIIKRMKELDGLSPSVSELRKLVADYISTNRIEFLPYLSHPETGSMFTEDQFEEYCRQVSNDAWGGEVELRAISHVLKRPIEVIQAKGSKVVIGSEYEDTGSTIILTYHRHMYGLGEHYNGVVAYEEIEEEFTNAG